MDSYLEIPQEDQEVFVMCLALGTLEAIRARLLPLDAGIWSLGRPVFWEPLLDAGIDMPTVKVLQTADELSALEESSGKAAADQQLDRMIAVIRERLSAQPNDTWYARWTETP